ncbi:MAG: transporter substrate-binding domain-containing protein [SAR324 cluster bacterium]|nr:transporter substrate-binding domain-containing protein [SAR324 cluster bacterium]
MKSLFITILFFALFLPELASAEKLKVCYLEWGKLGGEKLPNKGFIPDAVSHILKDAGYEVEVFIRPWNRCIELTKNLQFDLVADAWKGPTFDNDFDYLRTHHIDKISFIVRDDSPLTDGTFESLKGKRVGYLGTSGGLEKFYDNKHIFSEVFAVNTEAAMVRILVGRRVDAIVSDPIQMLGVAEKLSPPVQSKLRVLEPPLQVNLGAALISKKHPKKQQIMASFEKSFIKLAKTDIYDKLEKLHGVKLDLAPLN